MNNYIEITVLGFSDSDGAFSAIVDLGENLDSKTQKEYNVELNIDNVVSFRKVFAGSHLVGAIECSNGTFFFIKQHSFIDLVKSKRITQNVEGALSNETK